MHQLCSPHSNTVLHRTQLAVKPGNTHVGMGEAAFVTMHRHGTLSCPNVKFVILPQASSHERAHPIRQHEHIKRKGRATCMPLIGQCCPLTCANPAVHTLRA